MRRFERLPEFAREYKRLAKKYRSLANDLAVFERVLSAEPLGIGKNFVRMYSGDGVSVVKARLSCGSLKRRALRVVYAYRDDIVSFMYIELYFKGDKENEDKERIKRYIERVKRDDG